MASRQAAIAALTARGASNPEHLAAYIVSRTRGSRSVNLATPRYPVTSPGDVLVTRSQSGGAAVRHRRGGTLIGEILNDDGWRMVYDGKTSARPHTHQRGALAELIGVWNRGTTTLERPAAEALQPPPQQTPLMEQFGVPAIRALATPAAATSDGPRTTDDEPDADDPDNELSDKGKSIKKKLKAKGWDADKAHMFAKRAQNFGSGK